MSDSCPACRTTRSRTAMQVRHFQFRRCTACKTLFLSEPPDAEQLHTLYADERYFVNPEFAEPEADGFHGYLDYIKDRDHIEHKFAGIFARIEREVAPGKLLDVGAGPGFLLSAAERRGWSPLGLEINQWAADYARRELGVEMIASSIQDADLAAMSFDAVTMMDVIEHVPDPDVLVAAATELLRPGGVLAILTADAGSPVSRMLGGRWPEVKRAPEHLVLFSISGLKAMLGRHNLEVLGSHSVGKESSIATLLADVTPVAPAIGRPLHRLAERSRFGNRTFELDSRTKFCLYARRLG